jgi:hypothetical protein
MMEPLKVYQLEEKIRTTKGGKVVVIQRTFDNKTFKQTKKIDEKGNRNWKVDTLMTKDELIEFQYEFNQMIDAENPTEIKGFCKRVANMMGCDYYCNIM